MLKKSEEFRVYMFGILAASILIFILIFPQSQSIEQTFRSSLFHAVSFFTSTGFVADDYIIWTKPAVLALVLLMISGAMSGSTSGGLKLVRVILLYKNAKHIIRQGVHSNACMPIKLDGKIVPENVMNNVMAVFLMFIMLLLICVLSLVFLGMNPEEAFGASISCIFNAGPGLGTYGGFGSYADIPVAAKWILSAAMYLGRLEIATVLAVFMPSFWKN